MIHQREIKETHERYLDYNRKIWRPHMFSSNFLNAGCESSEEIKQKSFFLNYFLMIKLLVVISWLIFIEKCLASTSIDKHLGTDQ